MGNNYQMPHKLLPKTANGKAGIGKDTIKTPRADSYCTRLLKTASNHDAMGKDTTKTL